MPDTLQFLKTRKSISAPFLAAPGPNEAQLVEILGVASRVPDHGKLTPWRFIVFKGDAGAKASEMLAKLYAEKNPGADVAVKQLNNKPPTANSKGVRFGNFAEIRNINDEELEQVWNGFAAEP